MIQQTETWLKNKVKEVTATKSTGRSSAKNNNNSQEGTSLSAILSSIPTTSGSLHSTQGGDDGEDLDKGVDLVLACELNLVIRKKRSKPKEKTLKPIQQMIDEAPEMSTLPSFVDETIQSITSPTHTLSPESADNLDLSSTVLQVPSLINPSTNVSTSWLQQSLERKKKRMIQLEAPNLDVVADLMHKGTKIKKTKIDSRMAVNPTSGNLFVEIAQPVTEKDMNEANESDFSITKVDLGQTTHEGKEHNFQVLATILME